MGKSILIVDDMQQWLRFHAQKIRAVFEEDNFDINLTSKLSAKKAYEEVYNNLNTPFDLIITDLQMELDYEPEHAGEWLARNVRLLQQYNNTPVVIISASPDIKFIAQKLNVDYLAKNSVIHNPLSFELKLKEVLNR